MNRLTFKERSKLTKNETAKKLFLLMEKKKTNLCVALDLTTQKEVLSLADKIGPYIALLKTHVDILSDFTPDFSKELKSIAKKHEFLIFEDRKFADIGNTVMHQYSGGIYNISEWSDITNAHIIPGPGIIEGLLKVGLPKKRGLLLLAEMSSKDNMAKNEYTQKCIDWASKYSEFVIGFISLRKISSPEFVYLTPGIKLINGEDALKQIYRTPDEIITKNQSDIAIVGRDIILNENPEKKAQEYKTITWKCYENRFS